MCYGVMLHIYYISYYIYGVIFDISLYFQHNCKLQKILCCQNAAFQLSSSIPYPWINGSGIHILFVRESFIISRYYLLLTFQMLKIEFRLEFTRLTKSGYIVFI